MAFDLERGWALDPQVALRPEPFGALAYHFGTRRLSFLKSRTLLAVVEGLAGSGVRAGGVRRRPACRRPSCRATRGRWSALADSGMIA